MPGFMIFAAGFGTRMRPLTDDRPKPLIEVSGVSLLDRTVDMGRSANLSPIVVNAHYLADQIQAHVQGLDIAVQIEHPDILDTGGGLKAALGHFPDSEVVTSNSDAIWVGPNPVETALAAWNPQRMDALLVTVSPENAIGRSQPGDFGVDESGQISRGGAAIYGGIQIIKKSVVECFPGSAFSLNSVWDVIIASGRAYATTYPGKWADVGTPEGIQLAEELLKSA